MYYDLSYKVKIKVHLYKVDNHVQSSLSSSLVLILIQGSLF